MPVSRLLYLPQKCLSSPAYELPPPELTSHRISGTLVKSTMKKHSGLSPSHRLIATFAALFLLAAPFTATCCAHSSCAPITPTDTSSSPCHGAMTPEHQQSAGRQFPPMCSNILFPFQSPRSEGFLIASTQHKFESSNAAIPEITRLLSPLFSDTHWQKSADSARSFGVAASLTPLRL